MATLHAQIVLSDEGREYLRHLQPGQHLNVTFEIAPPEPGEYGQPPHAVAHDIPTQAEHLNRPAFSHYNQEHKR